jgi:hypothetical protein
VFVALNPGKETRGPATVSITARPSPSSTTVPLTVISCSGKPIPRNCTDRRLSFVESPAASPLARATWAIV